MNIKNDSSQLVASLSDSFEKRQEMIQIELKTKKKQEDWTLFLLHKSSDLPDSHRDLEQDKFLLHGCLYKVWLMTIHREGKLFIEANSDSRIMKGILALLVQMLSGLALQDIIRADLEFLHHAILNSPFSSARSTSLRNVEDRVKMSARQILSNAILFNKNGSDLTLD